MGNLPKKKTCENSRVCKHAFVWTRSHCILNGCIMEMSCRVSCKHLRRTLIPSQFNTISVFCVITVTVESCCSEDKDMLCWLYMTVA